MNTSSESASNSNFKKNINYIENSIDKLAEVLQLQQNVNYIAEENKKKVADMESKFALLESKMFDECSVCYNAISVKNTCCMQNCDHKLCKTCYYNWLDKQEQNTCPMCRANVFTDNTDIMQKKRDLEDSIIELSRSRAYMRRAVSSELEKMELLNDINEIKHAYKTYETKLHNLKDIANEINEYKKNPIKWKKLMEKREKKEVLKGKKKWRAYMKSIHIELISEYIQRRSTDIYKGGYISAYAQKDLERFTFGNTDASTSEVCEVPSNISDSGWINYIWNDPNPIDLSEENMFDEYE